MSLSPRQRMQVVDDIDSKIVELNATQKPRLKMQIIEDIDLLLAKLTGEAVTTPEPEQTLFQQIAKGVHDALGAVEVFNKIKSEVDRLTREIISGDSTLDKALLDACIKCADLAENEGIA